MRRFSSTSPRRSTRRSTTHGVFTIVSNDFVKTANSIADVTMSEGNSGAAIFIFTVSLSESTSQTVTVSFKTVNVSAKTTDNGFFAQTGTLTFDPGERTKTISIVVQGDTKKEAGELFYVNLYGNSKNSFFAKKRGIGTILNDD